MVQPDRGGAERAEAFRFDIEKGSALLTGTSPDRHRFGPREASATVGGTQCNLRAHAAEPRREVADVDDRGGAPAHFPVIFRRGAGVAGGSRERGGHALG